MSSSLSGGVASGRNLHYIGGGPFASTVTNMVIRVMQFEKERKG